MIRVARRSDLERVRDISQASQLPHWSERHYAHHLRDSALFLVLESERQVIAFVIVAFVLPEAELLRLAVAPEFRRQGWGGLLLEATLEAMASRGAESCFLEVRAGNKRAQRLYRRYGFQRQARRPGYYRDPVEDAIVMRRALSVPWGEKDSE